ASVKTWPNLFAIGPRIVIASVKLDQTYMNTLIATVAFTTAMLCAAIADAESANDQSQSIPLERIWALNMPGTQDIRQMGSSPKENASLVELIQQALGKDASVPNSLEGFVVQGTDNKALNKAFDVLANAHRPSQKLKANEKSWIVFFTHDSG